MEAWAVGPPGPLEVSACGVCRTDLHLCEGDLVPRRPGVTPGHQVVGTVVRRGPGAHRFEPGALVGAAWLASTCGSCRWCRAGEENLCPRSQYTGWDRDGGFAEYVVVEEAFGYALPAGVPPAELAPLLCAGIIGYRALHRAALPPGGRLGLYGFGASAHITAQIAMLQGAEVYVLTRGERNRQLAHELGAAFVVGSTRLRRRCWTRPSSSPRPASWCRSPWRPCVAVARSPSRGSTSATSRP
jgi:propanol-preferring alcohol dehydrogenase